MEMPMEKGVLCIETQTVPSKITAFRLPLLLRGIFQPINK